MTKENYIILYTGIIQKTTPAKPHYSEHSFDNLEDAKLISGLVRQFHIDATMLAIDTASAETKAQLEKINIEKAVIIKNKKRLSDELVIAMGSEGNSGLGRVASHDTALAWAKARRDLREINRKGANLLGIPSIDLNTLISRLKKENNITTISYKVDKLGNITTIHENFKPNLEGIYHNSYDANKAARRITRNTD